MSTLIFFASRLLFQTPSCCNRHARNALSNSRLAERHLKNTPKAEGEMSRAPVITITVISLERRVWSGRPATHAVPSTACLELFEQWRLVCQRCPQNKTLLRKHHHHHQPRRHVCVGGGDGMIENLDISISTTSFPPPEEEVEVRCLL